MTIGEWTISGPTIDEPEHKSSTKRTRHLLQKYHLYEERTDQHSRNAVVWTMFESDEMWLVDSERHLWEIFDDGGYSDSKKNRTPLGPLVGACHSGILTGPNDRIQAFSVTLKPPNRYVKRPVYYKLISNGVPAAVTLQQYTEDAWTDFHRQPLIRCEDCDVHPDVFTTWLDELNQWYVDHINPDTGRYSGVSTGR